MSTTEEDVKSYYGKVLKNSDDLQTNACCTTIPPKKHIKAALKNIHDEVIEKYYGCGLTIPSGIVGCNILDLGSGSGRDCYIASQLVGKEGKVIGVDMTKEQIDVAKKHLAYHSDKFGYSNVMFHEGNLLNLGQLKLENNSQDVIISNCVLNLTSNKNKVMSDTYALLKKGGEFYFSDVYADRRIPEHLQEDKVLWGECLSGALYWNDFLNMAKRVGFTDPRVISSNPIEIENEEVKEKVGDIRFYSVTYRLWKIESLESDCEDYGQAVRYRGGIVEEPEGYSLDNHHYFPKGKVVSVCGNTFLMLKETRLAQYFDFFGDFSTHYGIYEGCGGNMPFEEFNSTLASDCGC